MLIAKRKEFPGFEQKLREIGPKIALHRSVKCNGL